MTIEKVTDGYRITRKGFEDTIFTDSSNNDVFWKDAVAFSQEKGTVLQSLIEAIAFRLEAQGTEQEEVANNNHQATRTGAFYFLDKGNLFVAIDDIADPRKNIVIARVKEGREADGRYGGFLPPKRKLKKVLSRAEKAGRIYEAPEQRLELSLEEQNGSSPYCNSKIVKILEGDLVEPYAEFLKNHDRDRGFVWSLERNAVQALLEEQKKDKVLVCPIALGPVTPGIISSLFANDIQFCKFYDGGIARGTKHKRA